MSRVFIVNQKCGVVWESTAAVYLGLHPSNTAPI